MATAPGVQVSESLLRLQRIILRFRWGAFVLAMVAGVYLRQVGLLGSLAPIKLFAIAGLLSLASALDEYLLRIAPRHPRLALYGVALGDWLVGSVASAFAPATANQYPFVYFVPIVVASLGLGIPGGLILGLLSILSLTIETWYTSPSALGDTLPWIAAFLVAGGLAGYIGQQWESTQRHVEATYRWGADLSQATTPREIAEIILRYLENVLQIRDAAGAGMASHDYAVALLMADEEEGRFTAYAARGISPEVRARIRAHTGDGLLSWVAREGRPIWISLDDSADMLTLPNVKDITKYKSCLVAPIRAEGKLLALGLGFSTRFATQGETEVWGEKQFSQQAGAALKKSMVYAQMERQVGAFARILDQTRYSPRRDVSDLLRWAVEEAREMVAAGAVALAVRDKAGQLILASELGQNAEELVAAGDPARPSPADWVLSRQAPVIVVDFTNDRRFAVSGRSAKAFRSAVVVPLKVLDGLFGVLAAGSADRSHFGQNDLLMFSMLGQQVSLILEETQLEKEARELREALRVETAGGYAPSADIGTVRQKWQQHGQGLSNTANLEETYKQQIETYAREMHKLYELVQGQARQISEFRQEIEQAQHGTVMALATGLERSYLFLSGSGEAVAQLAVAIGQKLGCSSEEGRDLYYSGLLRDVGLMGLAPELLLATNLDEAQMTMVRRHAEIGHSVLSSFPFLENVANIVRHHHERWDGRGYPDRLAGEKIPLGSRILAVADVYEALTAPRSYREAISPSEAVDTIVKNCGSQFDPTVCEAFTEVFDERRDIAGLVLPELSQGK